MIKELDSTYDCDLCGKAIDISEVNGIYYDFDAGTYGAWVCDDCFSDWEYEHTYPDIP